MPPTHAKPAARRFDSLEQEAYLVLWRTYDRLRSVEDELFARFDVTPQQYNVLRLLKSAHPQAVPTLKLVQRLISRAPDVTRMLDKLECRRLITRNRPETDRRTILIGITEAGLALLDDIAEPLRECHERQIGHLSPTDLKKLIALLNAAREPHEPADGPWQN